MCGRQCECRHQRRYVRRLRSQRLPEGEGTSYLAPGYAPAASVDGICGVKLAGGAYLLQDYRSGEQVSLTYPTHDGMAFAGWYKNATFTTACTASDVEGAAYAKFVNITGLLLYKGGSPRMDVAQPSELTWLRFGYTMALPEGVSYIESGWYSRRFQHLSRRMFAGWQITVF